MRSALWPWPWFSRSASDLIMYVCRFNYVWTRWHMHGCGSTLRSNLQLRSWHFPSCPSFHPLNFTFASHFHFHFQPDFLFETFLLSPFAFRFPKLAELEQTPGNYVRYIFAARSEQTRGTPTIPVNVDPFALQRLEPRDTKQPTHTHTHKRSEIIGLHTRCAIRSLWTSDRSYPSPSSEVSSRPSP